MAKELFLEIGTEEIPAGMLPIAMRDLKRLVSKELNAGRIEFGEITTFATPRRLVLSVADVAEQQQRQELNLSGPSVKVAYDVDGNPTKAALGFARSNGVEVSELTQQETDKGTYLFLSKVIEGKPVVDELPAIMLKVVSSLAFKKSMRWKDMDVRFARPIHWLVALYGGEVVPFSYAGLDSGNESRGHRFMAPESFAVSGLEDYVAKAREHFVIVDPEERKQIISQEIERVATEEGGDLNVDAELLEEVAFLVEDPTPLCGIFDEEFLQLPDELLITSMKEHQRYFTLADSEGKLLPKFITISNTRAVDPDVVVKGNERVLRARLADAMFFWKEDQRRSLESRLESLKNVVYQAKLGTSYAKVQRFTVLAETLAKQLDPEVLELTSRAATLCKCDLETGMVYEFPELQGIMGREYAMIEGEDPRVATAIYEHYLPIQAGGKLPSDNVGAFVSLADKIDTVCGCFGVGLIPTGTADPYALRRCAIGILNIVLERGYRLSLPQLINQAVSQLEDKLNRSVAEVSADVLEFIRLRLVNMLTGQQYPVDVVEAVLGADFDDVIDARQRVQALADMKKQQDFAALAATFKRVGNIIKDGVDAEVVESAFVENCERELFVQVQRVQQEVVRLMASGDYPAALRSIAELHPSVDAFFDGVMVMANDETVKMNRLALLTQVAGLFSGLADFSRIAA
ncbi:MAG: glycine--tRNA ligase subunit beta [Desulfobacteraceae bacterium 4572_35.1]|nr:MAG: glycine--tRNA ligase subunit beta [Desulfobacteraceae bacterium 4572_35.1]